MIDWTAAGSILQHLGWSAMVFFWPGLVLLAALMARNRVPGMLPVAVPEEAKRLQGSARPRGRPLEVADER